MAGVGSAAARRRQRRRQFLRHERPSVAMALAESEDGKGREGGARGAQRITTTEAPSSPGFLPVVRRGGRRRGGAARGSCRASSAKAGSAAHRGTHCRLRAFCSDGASSRRTCAADGDQLLEILNFFSTFTPDPEQVIEGSKISLDDVPMRTAVRDTQLVEQLVEVPTNPGYVLAVVASKSLSRCELQEFSQDRVQQRLGPSRSLKLQFFRVGGEEVGRRSSRFSPSIAFSSGCGADLCYSSSWRSSRFSPRPGFHCFLIESIA